MWGGQECPPPTPARNAALPSMRCESPRPPPQNQMRRPINQQWHSHQIDRQINQPGHQMLLTKKQPPCPIHIELRPPEIINRNHNPSSKRLIFPPAPVIPQPPNSPKQQRRHHHVKQTKQPDKQRHVRIKHVLSAAENVRPGKNRPDQINRVQRLKKQKPASLPGKQQRTLQPKRRRNKQVSQITKI